MLSKKITLRLLAGIWIFVLVCGVVFLSVGGVALRKGYRAGGQLVDLRCLDTSTAMQVVVGCLSIVVGKFGLCIIRFGITWRRLLVLTVLLSAILFLTVSTGSLAHYWMKQNSMDLVERTLQNIRYRYGYYEPDENNATGSEVLEEYDLLGRNQALTDQMDATQEQLQCCGAVSPHDYVGSLWRKRVSAPGSEDERRVPHSCCSKSDLDLEYCLYDELGNNTEHVYQQGCAVLVKAFVVSSSRSVTFPTFALAFPLLCCVCILLYLTVMLKKGHPRRRRMSPCNPPLRVTCCDPAVLTSIREAAEMPSRSFTYITKPEDCHSFWDEKPYLETKL